MHRSKTEGDKIQKACFIKNKKGGQGAEPRLAVCRAPCARRLRARLRSARQPQNNATMASWLRSLTAKVVSGLHGGASSSIAAPLASPPQAPLLAPHGTSHGTLQATPQVANASAADVLFSPDVLREIGNIMATNADSTALSAKRKRTDLEYTRLWSGTGIRTWDDLRPRMVEHVVVDVDRRGRDVYTRKD